MKLVGCASRGHDHHHPEAFLAELIKWPSWFEVELVAARFWDGAECKELDCY